MSDRLIMLCPGQGAQAVGMGAAWREQSPAARRVFDRADEILGDALGQPLSTLCLSGPAEVLNRTDVSQPAIFVCSVACWHGLCEARDMTPSDAPLAAAAGLSLGEYTALHLAGALDFEAALQLVALRGRAMQEAAEAAPSGMLALIGADEEQARRVCDDARGGDVLVAANFNAPGQVVLSGSAAAIERAAGAAETSGLRSSPLPVAGAFHSPLMQPAADRLRTALEKASLRPPRCTVLSNVTGEPHDDVAGSIRRRLVEQLTWPVRWMACCQWLVGNVEGELHELAPGRTLAGLMRRIDRSQKVQTHETPED